MAIAVRAAWLALIVCVTLASSTVGALAQGTDAWVRLLATTSGSTSAQSVTAIELAPDWPNTRLILALRDKRLLRTRDGGGAWEELGPAPGDWLVLEAFGGARVT